LDNFEMTIVNGDVVYYPDPIKGVKWSTDRHGTPGKVTFKVVKDPELNIKEGNNVTLKLDGKTFFFGFIFTLDHDGEIMSVTAYDQLRYLKNKDTIVYKESTADQLLTLIANKFNLRTGTMDSTGYVIPSRIEDKKTLNDMMKNALTLTLQNITKLYVLYDEAGYLVIKDIENMKLNLLLDGDSCGGFQHRSSIDSNVYNKIKLSRENKATGKRDTYIAQDSNNINEWGVLQYYDTLGDEENGEAKANALLGLYNQKRTSLKAKKVLGDIRVRGGSSLVVDQNNVKKYMIVDRITHTFEDDFHFMQMDLTGGA